MLLFVGGMGAAFAPLSFADRKRAVHRFASFGLLLTWLGGIAAAESGKLKISELWLIGSLVLSALTHGVLVWSVLKEGRRTRTVFIAALVPLIITTVLMIYRTTWARLLG